MKTLRTVSALIVTVAMIAVMAIGAFAAENYDWNLLNIDYSSEADLEKAKIQQGASYAVKDGVLRINRNGTNEDHYFDLPEMKTSGKVVISTKFRTNSYNVALRINGANNSLKFNICVNGEKNLYIKGSANIVAENIADEKWHELNAVVDLDAKTIVLTVDGGTPFNGTFAGHSQAGNVDGVARVFWHVNSAAAEGGYLDVDYFRISDGKIAQGGSDSGSGSTDKPGTPETSDATFVALSLRQAPSLPLSRQKSAESNTVKQYRRYAPVKTPAYLRQNRRTNEKNYCTTCRSSYLRRMHSLHGRE